MAFKDIFGFERSKHADRRPQSCNLTKTLNSDEIVSELVRMPLGTRQPILEWTDTVTWGGGLPGTIRLVVSPIGSYKATIRKLISDSTGQATWVCKRIYPLNLKEKRTEQDWVQIIYEDVRKISQEGQDGSEHKFPKLERMVVNLASKIKQYAPMVFIYEGIRKSDDDNYIIYMGYRGQGVQRRQQRRCEQFNISVSYIKDRGLLHVWGYDITSPLRGHKWEVQPAEWNEYFTPSQKPEEIIEAIVSAVRSY
jgi:hypothetical protein